MDINLKVSPAELEAKATDFKGVMSQIKTLTDRKISEMSEKFAQCPKSVRRYK